MAKKTSGTSITIKGDVHAKRDVVMHDQYNNIQIANIQSPGEFTRALDEVRTQIATLRQAGQLSKPVLINLEAAEAKVAAAEEEAHRPQPVGEQIKTTLGEAKEYMDLISGSLLSATSLGTTLGGLALMAHKVFGG